jgi:endonuclease IV
MIRFGPAGIPLSCKGRTLKDGIEDVHNLGLTAMEAQLVRAHVQERAAESEETGLKPKNLTTDMVIEIVRRKGDKEQVISDLDEPIKKGDTLVALTSGIAKTYQELRQLREMADELDVALSIHTPYYMDLVGEGELSFRSMDSVRWAGIMAKELGATVVVTHMRGCHAEDRPEEDQGPGRATGQVVQEARDRSPARSRTERQTGDFRLASGGAQDLQGSGWSSTRGELRPLPCKRERDIEGAQGLRRTLG